MAPFECLKGRGKFEGGLGVNNQPVRGLAEVSSASCDVTKGFFSQLCVSTQQWMFSPLISVRCHGFTIPANVNILKSDIGRPVHQQPGQPAGLIKARRPQTASATMSESTNFLLL